MKTPDIPTIKDWTEREYAPASPLEVEHIRSLTNDVYLVKTPEGKFVLKVYGAGWRTESAIAWEVDLLEHLFNKGVKVSKARAGIDGLAVRTIDLGNGPRSAVLFDYAPGYKPEGPFTDEVYEAEGRAVAQMHAAGDDFSSLHERTALDLTYLIDSPVSDTSGLVSASDKDFLDGVGNDLKKHIEIAQQEGLDWGPVHGDMTFDNFHLTDNGDTWFYDFDSGGMGWRASDIQGWATNKENNPKWQAFLKGYKEVRALSDNDINTAPYIHAAWEVWGLSSDFTKRIAQNGDDALPKYIKEQLAQIQSTQQRLKEWEAGQK